MERTGDLLEIRGEITFEWKIKDFFQLSDEVNKCYISPKFYCFGTSWEIKIYPNGQTLYKSEGWIGLYIYRMSSGSPVKVKYSIGFKSIDGKTNSGFDFTRVFDEKCCGWGVAKVLLRSKLLEKKAELITSNALTVVCTLENNKPNDVAGSLFHRLQEMSDNFKEVYEKGIQTDFLLKVDGHSFGAHRLVLGARSPVFAAMFAHDSKENQTGEVYVSDVDKSAMEAILMYMYSGNIDKLTTESALSIYAAADKYGIKDIKGMCLEFIKENISVECLYEVIKFAKLYQEKEVSQHAKKFFQENAAEILETDEWNNFLREYNDIGIEFLSTALKSVLKK